MLLNRNNKFEFKEYSNGTSGTQTDETSDKQIYDITYTDKYDIIIHRYIWNQIHIYNIQYT